MAGIISKLLEVDTETGLDKKVVITTILIDGVNKSIKVAYNVSLVSPTGVEMKVVSTGSFERNNTGEVAKYDQLESSAIGIGIKQILQMDLNAYPDL